MALLGFSRVDPFVPYASRPPLLDQPKTARLIDRPTSRWQDHPRISRSLLQRPSVLGVHSSPRSGLRERRHGLRSLESALVSRLSPLLML